jgi:hypothetical protein
MLHDVHGLGEDFMVLDGLDPEGKLWVYRRQKGDFLCVYCGLPVTEGWMCFDTGDRICAQHVSIKGEMGQKKI